MNDDIKMGRNNFFQFKKFRIEQEKAAMKVNTDGVLLGAWTNITSAKNVLDIGAGTGLISLMIAQRSNAIITGVEIEKNAAEEAFRNVQNSEWNNRISILHNSFQEFAETSDIQFDVIVTNPPFFSNSAKNTNPYLSIARHNHLLPFEDIISGSEKLLNDNGILSLILPASAAQEFTDKAGHEKLFLNRLTLVKPFPHKEPNRCLLEFGKKQSDCKNSTMSVFDETGKNYSAEFKTLARDFYLKL
jgi:tRNA1Val (adenine37-N6)-methyltransferase